VCGPTRTSNSFDIWDHVWCMMYDVWCMMHVCNDVWCIVGCLMYGVWCMNVWCMMYDVWMYYVWCECMYECMMYDVWCMTAHQYEDMWGEIHVDLGILTSIPLSGDIYIYIWYVMYDVWCIMYAVDVWRMMYDVWCVTMDDVRRRRSSWCSSLSSRSGNVW